MPDPYAHRHEIETESRRTARVDRMLAHIESIGHGECVCHERSCPGADPHGRYVVVSRDSLAKYVELVRCSSRERANDVGEFQVKRGWTVTSLYDLDEVDDSLAPRRYAVASVRAFVAFDTIASPA